MKVRRCSPIAPGSSGAPSCYWLWHEKHSARDFPRHTAAAIAPVASTPKNMASTIHFCLRRRTPRHGSGGDGPIESHSSRAARILYIEAALSNLSYTSQKSFSARYRRDTTYARLFCKTHSSTKLIRFTCSIA